MSKKTFPIVYGIVLAVTTIFVVKPLVAGAMSEKEKTEWVWTKDHPRPVWWTWKEDYNTAKPVRGGYLRYAVKKYAGVLNPNHWPVNDWSGISKIYEKLVYNDGSYKASIPWLAESWEWTDPVTCIMKLRKGIQFHDGTDFNADALGYQIEWILDKKNNCWDRAWLEPVQSVEITDEYTIKWNFKRPWGAFFGVIANPPGFAISKKALEQDVALREAEKLIRMAKKAKKSAARAEKKARATASSGGEKARKTSAKANKARERAMLLEKKSRQAMLKVKGFKATDVNPIGTGRYMLEEARPGYYLKLKRNPTWWFGRSIGKPEMPYFDGQILIVIPDPAIQLANLRAGKIDVFGFSDPSQSKLLKDDPHFNIYIRPGNQLIGLNFNMAKGPCRDIRVRKAISHAIDRKALVHGVVFGLATPATCIYNEGHWCHNPDLKPVEYNPELSKKLLTEAGYAKGLKISGYLGQATTMRNLGLAVKGMLAEVGIDWTFDSIEYLAMEHRMADLDYDLAQGGYPWIWDPDPVASLMYHPKGPFNRGRSHNEKAIDLIEAGKKEIDEKKRQKIYWELEKVLYENCQDVWLWWPKFVSAYSKKIKGYDADLHNKGQEGYWFSHCRWFEEGHP